MHEDSYLDSYWEDQNEIPDMHDEWEEWEKDRLCEDMAAEREWEDDGEEIPQWEEDADAEDAGDLEDWATDAFYPDDCPDYDW